MSIIHKPLRDGNIAVSFLFCFLFVFTLKAYYSSVIQLDDKLQLVWIFWLKHYID